jgi:hypothetical protein
MFVSTRKRFRKGDKGWAEYINFVGLPALSEIRTIDSALNCYADGAGDIECSPETLSRSAEALPIPKPKDEYYLLAINRNADFAAYIPRGWKLLGHDLSDETQTSSLLNCGPWEGLLRPFTERLNSVGLLCRDDAESAQRLLPQQWGEGMDHAQVAVWALYERE